MIDTELAVDSGAFAVIERVELGEWGKQRRSIVEQELAFGNQIDLLSCQRSAIQAHIQLNHPRG
jgi:hypothetical protein